MNTIIGANSQGLTWTAVTKNNGDSPITDLAGYRVYQDGAAVAETVVNQYVWPTFPLNHGASADFFVTAFDTAGNESPASLPVTLTADLLAPKAPTNLGVL